MAIRAACASTAFLTATTWATVDTSVTSGTAATYLASEAGGPVVSTTEASNRASAGFTPGAITIDGIGLRVNNRTGTNGTFSVQLYNLTDTAVVAGTLVTINVSDMPAFQSALLDGGWMFFKFAAPVTLTAAKAYVVSPVTSVSNQVQLFRDATTSNWSRYLRTTTTGAPATGDDVIIAGEWTAAATVTTRTVTMDETAATDYGSAPTAANGLLSPGIAIGEHGVLTFKDTSAANPYLRLSNSLIIYNGGTINIGTVATPIPRDSTAILEFDLAADGDYGLIPRNGSIVNIQGLSRTSGKNVVSAKLNADSFVNLVQTVTLGSTGLVNAAATTTLDPTGTSLGVNAVATGFNILIGATDSAANQTHRFSWPQAAAVTNTTQVYTIWVKRGSGTNNRFIRIQLGDTLTSPPTNGFYADVDLQAGTIGAVTAAGTGTATSSAITAFGGGFICTIIGKASTASVAPIAMIFACNASTVTTYVGDATQNFICTWPQVYTAASQPTQDTINTDTGWLSGDVVALASTTRTANECEVASLSANAGASTLTYNLYPVNAHSGTSPTQAEVILLSRNVKVRSTSPTLMTYMNVKAGAVVDIDWVEFYYLGVNANGQFGIEPEVNTTAATNFSMQFCSLHDFEAGALRVTVTAAGGTLTALTFSSNVMWNVATVFGAACSIGGAITSTAWTIDSNITIRTGSGNGWTLSDVGGTFTNNTVVGSASIGISLNENAAVGTATGLVTHSNGNIGFGITASVSGSIGLTSWRNAASGFNANTITCDLTLASPVMFGNTTRNIFANSGAGELILESPVLSGDTTFATTSGIDFTSASIHNVIINNGDFSTVTGIKTAHTNDINIAPATAGQLDARIVLRNTKLGASVEVATPSNLSNNGFIASEKHDQTAGNHMTWMKNGKVQTDSVIFNTLSPSMRMTPTSATLKLESEPQFQGMKVAVANGATVTPGIYVRKSVVGDGVAYNGNQPRLILKANPAIGISADAVIATAAAAAGTWEQLTGTTAAATDDGVMEFVIDADGTAGWINVDDRSAA